MLRLVGEAARSSRGAPVGRRGFVNGDLRCTTISFSNPVRKPKWRAEMDFRCGAAGLRTRISGARIGRRAKSIILDCQLWEGTDYTTLERQFKGNQSFRARSPKVELRSVPGAMHCLRVNVLVVAADQSGDVAG